MKSLVYIKRRTDSDHRQPSSGLIHRLSAWVKGPYLQPFHVLVTDSWKAFRDGATWIGALLMLSHPLGLGLVRLLLSSASTQPGAAQILSRVIWAMVGLALVLSLTRRAYFRLFGVDGKITRAEWLQLHVVNFIFVCCAILLILFSGYLPKTPVVTASFEKEIPVMPAVRVNRRLVLPPPANPYPPDHSGKVFLHYYTDHGSWTVRGRVKVSAIGKNQYILTLTPKKGK